MKKEIKERANSIVAEYYEITEDLDDAKRFAALGVSLTIGAVKHLPSYKLMWEEIRNEINSLELLEIQCTTCDGSGEYWVDESRFCMTLRNECCGGCGSTVDCEDCSGTGKQTTDI